MSDCILSSRSRSSLHGVRTPLKLIQPPHSFIERVNKIFENTKRTSEKSLESDRFQSPYLLTRSVKFNTNQHKTSSKHITYKKKKLQVELGALKLSRIFQPNRLFAMNKIKFLLLYRPLRNNESSGVSLQMIESIFQKYIPQVSQPQPAMLTKCEKCCHVGLNICTGSTKENLSPRFIDKVKQLLPKRELKKSISDVSTLPMSELYQETCWVSPYKEMSRDSLLNFSPNFCGNSRIQIPRLNISEVSITQQKARYSEEVLKGSPIKKLNEAELNSGVEKLSAIFNTRVHRGFDMIFLARANARLQDQSLTFEFTLEESKISNEPSTLTGTFGENQRIFEISEIKKGRDDSFSVDYSEHWSKDQTYKTACKILYTRLDKLFYRRKVRGFYSLVDHMY